MAITSGLLFASVLTFELLTDDLARTGARDFAWVVAQMVFGCAFVGWIIHGVVVSLGLGRPTAPDTQAEAEDYDDEPTA